MRARLGLLLIVGAANAWVGAAAPAPAPQDPNRADPRFAGLEWTFVRLRYFTPADQGSPGGRARTFRFSELDEPWAIDHPAAEDNLSRRLRTVTNIKVKAPLVLEIEDPRLFEHPWAYLVEPGNWLLKESEVPILREYLLRGGTLEFDDFHGPFEWENLERQLKRIFPDRAIVEIAPPHPIFTCFYKLEKYPQIPGLGSFLNGRTWEKGGYEPHLRAILDDRKRAMVLINWNTDMADAWEWSNATDFPDYLRWTGEAYRIQINEIIYALTH